MADSLPISESSFAAATRIVPATAVRHSATVRFTHWLTVLCFFALLVSGLEIVVSHPRFYWGDEGNVNTRALFSIPIPASRASVPTGYDYTLPDQNGWSRSLHFESAWLIIAIGLWYGIYGLARDISAKTCCLRAPTCPRQRWRKSSVTTCALSFPDMIVPITHFSDSLICS